MKNTIRKISITLLFCLLFVNLANAQKQTDTFLLNNVQYSYISLPQLINYYNMDSISFHKEMIQQGFALYENIYAKGELKNSKLVFGKTSKFGLTLVWITNDPKISFINKLLENTKGFNSVSAEDGFYFVYQNYIITVKKNSSEHNVVEEITIIEKTLMK